MGKSGTINSSDEDQANLCSWIFFYYILRRIVKGFRYFRDILNYTEVPRRLSIEKRAKDLKKNFDLLESQGNPSLLRALALTFCKSYIWVLGGMTLQLLSSLSVSTVIMYLTAYFQETNAELLEGLLYVLLLLISLLLFSMFLVHNAQASFLYGGLMNMASVKLLIEKFFQFRINESTNIGKIITNSTSDLNTLQYLYSIGLVTLLPLFAVICIVFTWLIIGWTGIIPSLLFLLAAVSMIVLANRIVKHRMVAASAADKRSQIITNVIEGMRVVKMQTWEYQFNDKIREYRKVEIAALRKASWYKSAALSLGSFAFGPVLFITIMAKIWSGEDLTLPQAIGVLSAVFSIQWYLVSVPGMGVALTSNLIAANRRVTKCMQMRCHDSTYSKTQGDAALQLVGLSTSWKSKAANEKSDESELNTTRLPFRSSMDMTYDTLQDITLSFEPGKLFTIIGPVGSGKSSLLLSILGELNINSGEVIVNGTTAYCSQDPWILSASIKDNIIMGCDWDEERYRQTIHAWALEDDIQSFAQGDETLLGDKGINISGGQKARVGLARAVYSNWDIVLLDDPISAVDAQVSSFLLNKCINGILSDRTRILVTHQIHALQHSDHIIVLDKGMVIASGPYSEISQRPDIVDLITEFSKTQDAAKHGQENIKADDKEFEGHVEKESTQEGFVSFGYYLEYLKAAWGNYCSIFVICIVEILVVINFLCMPWILIELIDNEDQQDAFYVGLFAFLSFFLPLGGWLRHATVMNILLSISYNLWWKMLRAVVSAKSVFFDSNPSGRILNRFSTDTHVIDDEFQIVIITYLDSLFLVSGVMLVNFISNPIWIIPFVFMALGIFFLIKYIISCAREAKRTELTARSPLLTLISNCQTGLASLRAFGYQSIMSTRLDTILYDIYKAYYTYNALFRTFLLYMMLLFNLFMVLNTLILVLLKDTISVDMAIATLSFISVLMGLLPPLGKFQSEILTQMPSVERIIDYSKLEQEKYQGYSGFEIQQGTLELVDVWMRYRPELDYSLCGLSFKIAPGTKTGIVGRTGAGKSTLMQVLFRLTELESGKILIDGEDISQQCLADVRRQISVIQQSPFIFAATVRENLDPFDNNTDDELWEVLKDVQLATHFNELPDGLETILDEKQFQLSVGQKQLMCLARAILSKNKILMLDEATANVDMNTDAVIQSKIREKFDTCTVLTIAHRINTILDYDKVLVLGAGKLLEHGSPEELLLNPESHFSSMHRAFYKE